MRDTFDSYYPVSSSEEDIEKLWKTGGIVLDANVLLNIHRLSADSRDDLIHALQSLKSRLWIPHMYALEYHENLSGVLRECRTADETTIKNISTSFESIRTSLTGRQKIKHQSLNPSDMLKQLEELMDNWKAALPKTSCVSQNYKDEESLFSLLDELLLGCVGDAFDNERLQEIYASGKIRYQYKQPPGYQDAKKNGQLFYHNGVEYDKQFGDLVGWLQILEHFSGKNTHVMMVSDDVKDDWVHRIDGQTVGPRPELLREAKSFGIECFKLYTIDSFLKTASERQKIEVATTTIAETHEIRLRIDDKEIIKPLVLALWAHLNSLGSERNGQPFFHPDINGHAQSLELLLPELLRKYELDNDIDIENLLLTLVNRRDILAGHDLLALSSLANNALRTKA